jgi:hypothetical protein
MNQFAVLGAMLIMLASPSIIRADDGPGQGDCPHCKPKTKDVCFNLVCHYKFEKEHGLDSNDNNDHDRECSVASTFTKAVTEDGGGEVQDASDADDKLKLQVSCEGLTVYNDGGHRYTDLLGSRFQGITGPDPAFTLPRGALHAARDGDGHYAPSILELNLDDEFKRGRGSCFIWTGPQPQ